VSKRVLFLMSDTGGGHRAAAEAIRDALYQRYGQGNVEATLVDVFKDYFYFPMNLMPEFYPLHVKYSKTSYGMTYKLTNTRRRAAMISRGMHLQHGTRLKRLPQDHPADVVVSVHSVISRPTMRTYTMLSQRPPFVTVVTDLVSTHLFWYDRRVEKCMVPTQAAYERGRTYGLKDEQLLLTGLPVHPHFMDSLSDAAQARHTLSWEIDRPTILMVAGGDGMGPLFETARAINDLNLHCQLVIVAGRNKSLKQKLDAQTWNQPTHIYPFVTNMPQMMAASDILVTKAGPATISEAAIAGLPMILNDAIPGQEEGNVQHVITHNAGVYAPKPRLVAEAVKAWLAEGDAGLQQRSENARRIAYPDAVWRIADEIWHWAHQPSIIQPKKNLLEDLAHRTRRFVSPGL